MSLWSLLLCEGPHDQEFLCCLTTIAGDWQHHPKRPDAVPKTFEACREQKYLYLLRNDRALVVAGMNGIGHIIPEDGSGKSGRNLAEIAKHAYAVGIILDADGKGVAARVASIQSHYGSVVPAARSALHGVIAPAPAGSSDQRKFGLWVAPDGVSGGSLDNLIRRAADELHPTLTPIADGFITELGKKSKHDWLQYREKAVLASLGQQWQAGGSLASTISAKRDQWMSKSLGETRPFKDILNFVSQLLPS